MSRMSQTAQSVMSSAPQLLPAVDLSKAASDRRSAVVAPELTYKGFVIRHHTSIAEIAEAEWNRLFSDVAEDWSYFRACERSGSAHFSFSAVAAYKDGRLVAAAPVFRLNYRLDMTLPERFKAVGDFLARYAPRLVKVPVMGMGSPMTEECPIGIDPALDGAARDDALAALIRAMELRAKAAGAKILAIKDVTDSDAQWSSAALAGTGFTRMASLPLATLALPYDDFEGYIQSLPGKQRNDIRRKLKAAKDLQVEFRDDVEDVYDEILALYRATRANRKASYEAFDEVPEDYFREVMRSSHGKARVMLCRLDGRLVSFNFFLVEKDKVIGKFVGMDYEVARAKNLYFFNWMTIVRFCIDKGIEELQTGQTTYTVKVRLGCKVKRSWIYFKYTGGLIGPLVRFIGPRLSFEDADPELAPLSDKLIYLAPDA
jgi:predicted N-acyltransferase